MENIKLSYDFSSGSRDGIKDLRIAPNLESEALSRRLFEQDSQPNLSVVASLKHADHNEFEYRMFVKEDKQLSGVQSSAASRNKKKG